jgi:hypothetical protein
LQPSNDYAGYGRDSKFNPLVLGEIQAADDNQPALDTASSYGQLPRPSYLSEDDVLIFTLQDSHWRSSFSTLLNRIGKRNLGHPATTNPASEAYQSVE